MKSVKLGTLLFSLLLFSVGLLAQDTGGTVQFWHAKQPVFDSDGETKLAGDRFRAQLYAGPTEEELKPVGPVFEFGTGKYAGFIEFKANRVIAISSLGQGSDGVAQMRAWEASEGEDYDSARKNFGKHGVSNVIAITTGGGRPDPAQATARDKWVSQFSTRKPPAAYCGSTQTGSHPDWPSR